LGAHIEKLSFTNIFIKVLGGLYTYQKINKKIRGPILKVLTSFSIGHPSKIYLFFSKIFGVSTTKESEQ
jgi:hypothetical protein